MKDLVITGRRIAHELWIFAGCFAAALCVNVYAIIRFKTEWKELITTLHITLGLAAVFFGILALLRILVFSVRRILQRKAA